MTNPEPTLRPYQPGDETQILQTFNRVFREVCGPGYVDRTPEYWRWEFLANPEGNRIALAVCPDGTVAAQYAGVPYRMHTAFGDRVFVHIVDSMVHPEFRKGLKKPGLFIECALPWFEDCHRRRDSVLYGYPVVTAERIGQRYLEYKRLRVVDYLVRDAAAGPIAAPAAIAVERVATFPAETDQLFARVAAEKHCLTRRDQRYLDWRYVQIPGGGYECYLARRAGVLCGAVVLRTQLELVPGGCGIVDWLALEADTETHTALLATAVARGAAAGRRNVLAVLADTAPEHAWLRGQGFAVVPSGEYLERRLTHRIYDPQLTTEWLLAHWWYTLGDSDLA